MTRFVTQNLRLEERPDGIALLGIDVPQRSVNVLSSQVRSEFQAALEHVAGKSAIKLLVIRSTKKSGFLAGADIHEFTEITGPEQAQALAAEGQALFDRLAELKIPTIALIHGPCLGGGLELALACDYRLLADGPKTQIGFPEIELGLLPAWGGTQRLPRRVGLERSLKIILARRRLDAKEALRWGLADAIAPTEKGLAEELNLLIDRALVCGKRPALKLPLLNWRQRFLESNPLGRRILLRGAERILRRKVPEGMPAPFEALAAVRAGQADGFRAGLAAERAAAGRLASSPASQNLISLFIRSEQARKMPPGADQGQGKIRKVGIVGAGVMGAGIAQLAALRGFQVVVQEINQQALSAGLEKISSLLAKAVEKGLISRQAADQKLALIRGTITWEDFSQTDLVVEAAAEDLQIKRTVFDQLRRCTRNDTILATNTSSLLVHDLGGDLADSGRLAGLHFFNPVHKMPLVEVVRTQTTQGPVADELVRWVIDLGKIPVLVRDSPGFLVNRIIMPYLTEAVRLVGEGNAIHEIDETMRRFGMPMGPLELLDQIGLDVAAHVAAGTKMPASEEPADFSAQTAFRQIVNRGWLGQKAKAGFYLYRGRKAKENKEAAAWLRNAAGQPAGRNWAATFPAQARIQEARERMVLLMVNEAARCLEEGLAVDAATIDLAMVLGTGWAPHRGGPLKYALDRGIEQAVHGLESLADRYGRRFQPEGALLNWRKKGIHYGGSERRE